MNPPQVPPDVRVPFVQRNALALKIGGIALLVLLLQIPLGMVDSLLRERRQRRDTAVAEITQLWGKPQTLVGPVLAVPYTYHTETEETSYVGGQKIVEKKRRAWRANAFFLPEQLTVVGKLDPESRYRGIYAATVYTGHIKVTGNFRRPDFAALGIAPAEVRWSEAWVSLGLSDLRGTREALTMQWAGVPRTLLPGLNCEIGKTGLHAPLPDLTAAAETLPFALEVTLNGSESLSLIPVGRQTTARISAAWPDPSFTGAFLPTLREVRADGFNAQWQVSYYGRDFPQQWTDRTGETKPEAKVFAAASFGVNLVAATDAYRTTERALKHGVLFLALIFTAFFLFEMGAALRLHGLHYGLVGAALCLFYLGLLALAEFTGFGAAYGLAAAASTLLIVLYSLAILHSGGRTLIVAVALIGVYGYLYFVLQMQDYALLAGTGVLFVALAAVMWVTRRLAATGKEEKSAVA
ncbi:MAG: cell envelope integrity protein CreD [Opitutae bacterium]|nr:cell envelope integrity protein CreD [Opitutae bacterium]